MTFVKNRATELEERGFGEIDGGVCLEHITDSCLSQRLEDFVTEYNCAVCGTARPSEKNASFAVPLEKLMDAVVETVRHFYADAEAVLPWDSEDGVLVGPKIDTRDVIEDIADGAFDNAYFDRIIELISSVIGYQTTWTSWFAATDGAVTGKVIRVPGEGLLRVDETKSAAGRRTIPLPKFAVDMLLKRRQLLYLGEQVVIFPSTAGTLRDPNNFGKEWRAARQELGVAEVTTHSFRKTVATLIDDERLSARIGADHLGHSHVSMTQDRYMTRGRIHTQVADLLDRAVRINDE